MPNSKVPKEPEDQPVKYVLYSHYAHEDGKDKQTWMDNKKNGKPFEIDTLKGIKRLEQHFDGLDNLLNHPGHEGLLILFYAQGLGDFLKGIKENEEERISPDLEFAEAFGDCVRRKLQSKGLEKRVKFLTPLNLKVLFGRVNKELGSKFWQYFVAADGEIRYDTTKIVEAILRLRLLGHGVPVFRLDHDVLFRTDFKIKDVVNDLGLFQPLASVLKAYRLRLEDPRVSTFIFSASYDTKSLKRAATDLPAIDRFLLWSRAFATRMQPTLKVNAGLIENIIETRDSEKENFWGHYIELHFDEILVRKFYGLHESQLSADGIDGLIALGAHPLVSVISGALLCVSDGAILDLPPFSNFRQNVMWIDDHLKYCLHRELRHFTTIELRNLAERALNDAKLDDVIVTKARPAVQNLHVYILSSYLPTLLWGTIMDAWITPNATHKCRRSMLKKEFQDAWLNDRKNVSKGIMPEALHKAILASIAPTDSKGRKPKDNPRSELKLKLETQAIKRINLVRKQWAKLKASTGQETFASLWASGCAKSVLRTAFLMTEEKMRGLNPNAKPIPTLWWGIADPKKVPANKDLTNLDQLNPEIKTGVDQLVADTLDYISWTLDWPRFVQIVRSVEQGDFAGDMTLRS